MLKKMMIVKAGGTKQETDKKQKQIERAFNKKLTYI